MHTNSSLLLIGSGRLALHLKHWLKLNNPTQVNPVNPVNLLTWSRHEPIETLASLLNKTDTALLAIKDDAVISFYETHLEKLNIRSVHFSGALHDSRLISAHPLMSFTNELLPDEVYPQIHFTLSGVEKLTDIFPHFNNNYSLITPEQKPLYHALCVIAGNFPQLLWLETLSEMKKLNLPPAAFELYLQQITQNFIKYKNESLTGPLVRKDLKTIEKNINALKNQKKLQNIYQTFVQEFLK